jgi:hypothetical protein
VTLVDGAALLPHSLDLERAVLHPALVSNCPVPELDPKDVFRYEHGLIAGAILEAERRGLSREYQIVREILRERSQLDTVGEVHLLDLVTLDVRPSPTALASSVEHLKDLARKRHVVQLLLR